MSVQDMTKLVAHALKDDEFRAALLQNPEDTVKAAGYELSEEEFEAIRSVDLNLSEEELEERVSKFWGSPSPINPANQMGGIANSAGLKTVSAFKF
jgi:hypothetical protein